MVYKIGQIHIYVTYADNNHRVNEPATIILRPNWIQTRNSYQKKIAIKYVIWWSTVLNRFQWSHIQLLRVLECMQIVRWLEIITDLLRLWVFTNFMATKFMVEPYCWLPTRPVSHSQTSNVDSVRRQSQGRRTLAIVEWFSKVSFISVCVCLVWGNRFVYFYRADGFTSIVDVDEDELNEVRTSLEDEEAIDGDEEILNS